MEGGDLDIWIVHCKLEGGQCGTLRVLLGPLISQHRISTVIVYLNEHSHKW